MKAEDSVKQALERAGYAFVQTEPHRLAASSSFQPDILAWAADEYGKLVPWAVVEIKNRPNKLPPQIALPQLVMSRDILGTVDHYVVMHGDWYQADDGLRNVTPVAGPAPPQFGAKGELDDVDLATALFTEQLWRWAQVQRRQGRSADEYGLAPELNVDGVATPSGTVLPASREVLWEARRRALVDFARRGREAGIYTSHPVIAKAVAHLAGNKLDSQVLDPFLRNGYVPLGVNRPCARDPLGANIRCRL